MYKININRDKHQLEIKHVDKKIKVEPVERKVYIRSKQKRGLPGPGGSDKNYVQAFTNSALITVNHHLNKRPAVSIENTAGDEVEGEVEYININTLAVRFSSSFSGRVICN
jgi:hypothetical protein